jgi:3D (Asp-Asp-Asp) domain-containing protein
MRALCRKGPRAPRSIPYPATSHSRTWLVQRHPLHTWAIILTLAACCIMAWAVVDGGSDILFAAGQPATGAVAITIIADGQQRAVTTEPVTVAEALASAGIAVSELDRVEPKLDTLVFEAAVIRVTRVARERVTREIEIPIGTQARYDPRVRRPIVLREGLPGRAQAELEVWKLDGRETERIVISQRVIERMKPRMVVRGGASLPSRGGAVMYMEATGYDPGPRSCGRYSSGHTAVGLHAGKGVVAVDPRVIPLGTRLYVEGYGECVAGDVGSAIKGRRIDLGFDTYRQALSWGRRTVRVHIVD